MIAPRRIAHLLGGGLLLGLGALLARPAQASSDDSCEIVWRIEPSVYGECHNVAALTPGNDTRVNLLLLLLDRHGLPSEPLSPVESPVLGWRDLRDHFAGLPQAKGGDPSGDAARAPGWDTTCHSEGTGAAAFRAAVEGAAGLSPEERASLIASRAAVRSACAAALDPASDSPAPQLRGTVAASEASAGGVAPRSDLARAFGSYVEGTRAFYDGRYGAAVQDFSAAKGGADPWLADTAEYMIARAKLNALQDGRFDAYGTPVDEPPAEPEAIAATRASLDAYLEHHPDGRYAASARGLERRVAWLSGRTDQLAALCSAALADARGTDDLALVQEIDSKLLPKLTPEMTRDPTLLAVLDLKAMRRPPDPGAPKPTRPDLDAQRDAFAGAPDLYAFLRATAAFTFDASSAAVLGEMRDDTRRRGGDYLWLSRQFLRGRALEAAGDRNAAGFWRDLRAGADRPLDSTLVELALALHDERHRRLDDVFAPGSAVTDPAIRTVLLRHDAGPELLRSQAQGPEQPASLREAAWATLLFKELTRGRAADFLSDLAAARGPAGGQGQAVQEVDLYLNGASAGELGCPRLTATAARLAADPASVRDRLCLAEFVRLNGLDGDPVDVAASPGELGSGPSAFPGQPYGRGAVYASIIVDRAAPAEERAYALYRAVKCYEPTGTSSCGPDAPRSARKAWFVTLKRDYPGSRWAKRLHLWW